MPWFDEAGPGNVIHGSRTEARSESDGQATGPYGLARQAPTLPVGGGRKHGDGRRTAAGIAQIQVGNWRVAVEVDPSLHHSFPII